MSGRVLKWAVVALLLAVHLFGVGRAWTVAARSDHARDFASYHYAVSTAIEGDDPYDVTELDRRARTDHTRRKVYPFLYPPSFLVPMAWTSGLSLKSAYLGWFWACETMLLATLVVVVRLIGDGRAWVPTIGLMALATCFPNNLAMGQANIPVLLLALLGLLQVSKGREYGGGVLVGLAVAMKLSPALLVIWLAFQGRWRTVVGAVLGLGGLMAASVLMHGWSPWYVFFIEVLPDFSGGGYNGLGLPVALFGNHSLPNVIDALLPGPGTALSDGARMLSTGTALILVAGSLWLCRRSHAPSQLLTQAAGLMVLMLLVPVFTYEHHLIWAWPAFSLAWMSVLDGRVSRWAVGFLLVATVVWCWDLGQLKVLAHWVGDGGGWVVREAKFTALLLVGSWMLYLGYAQPYERPLMTREE